MDLPRDLSTRIPSNTRKSLLILMKSMLKNLRTNISIGQTPSMNLLAFVLMDVPSGNQRRIQRIPLRTRLSFLTLMYPMRKFEANALMECLAKK